MNARAKLFGLVASAAVASILPSVHATAAQQAGTYSGHTADGNTISFDVGSNPQGQPVLLDVAIKFSAFCPQAGSSMAQSWKFFFSNGLPIVHGHVKHLENGPQLYLLNAINFHSGRVSGTTEAKLPMLEPGKSPSSTQLCSSAKQAFEASYQGADGTNFFDHPGDPHLKTPQRTAILEWSSQGVTHQELRKEQ